jgi:polysaccharide export outer membrane protein
MSRHVLVAASAAVAAVLLSAPAAAQSSPPRASTPGSPASATPSPAPAANYLIGADDVLTIDFWRDPSLSGDVIVRPDGKITLKQMSDIQAAGLTTSELTEVIKTAAAPLFTNPPVVTVIVKQINSRKVSITGSVIKPNRYPLTDRMTIMDLISLAGGLQDWAKVKDIILWRTENGKQVPYKFNYEEFSKGRKPDQNRELKPGDLVVVR